GDLCPAALGEGDLKSGDGIVGAGVVVGIGDDSLDAGDDETAQELAAQFRRSERAIDVIDKGVDGRIVRGTAARRVVGGVGVVVDGDGGDLDQGAGDGGGEANLVVDQFSGDFAVQDRRVDLGL